MNVSQNCGQIEMSSSGVWMEHVSATATCKTVTILHNTHGVLISVVRPIIMKWQRGTETPGTSKYARLTWFTVFHFFARDSRVERRTANAVFTDSNNTVRLIWLLLSDDPQGDSSHWLNVISVPLHVAASVLITIMILTWFYMQARHNLCVAQYYTACSKKKLPLRLFVITYSNLNRFAIVFNHRKKKWA